MKTERKFVDLEYGKDTLPLVIVIAVVAVLEFIGFLTPFRRVGERIIAPIIQVNAGIARAIQLPFFVVTQSFSRTQRLQDLEFRYAEALAQLGERDQLKKENEELRKLLGETGQLQSSTLGTITSYGKPTISFASTAQVQEGQGVLIAQTLIGRIETVSAYQAEVTLLSSPQSRAVLAKTESGITGIVVGDGKKVLMKEIPIETELKVGERVVTVGQEGIQPGVFIGRVQVIEKQHGAPTQIAVLDQLVNFYQSSIVEIKK